MKICATCKKPTPRNLCPRCHKSIWVSAYSIQYTPAGTRDWEKHVGLCAKRAMEEAGITEFLSGPITLRLKQYFQIPKTRSKKLSEGMPHLQRPDVSNVGKSVEDGLNRVLYRDDATIYRVAYEKLWGNTPRVEVEVEN